MKAKFALILLPAFGAACFAQEDSAPRNELAFGLGGIALSYYMYVMNQELPNKIASALGGFYTLVYNKYFVDEVYDATVVNPLIEGSTAVLWHGVDQGIHRGIGNAGEIVRAFQGRRLRREE